MYDQDSPFFKRSKEIAEQFLQTTVIVDDEAYYGDTDSESQGSSVDEVTIRPPGRSGSSIPNVEKIGPDQKTLKEMSEEKIVAHRLEVREIVNSFALKHIVCSVIKPSKDDPNLVKMVENLAASADIIVIDWNLHTDEGKKALNILEQIIKSSNEAPAKLRLFVIYTAEPDIFGIAKKIKEELKRQLEVDIQTEDEGLALTFDSTRIAIFVKPDTNPPTGFENRRVLFEDLVDRVTSEFTVMTAGLVSNVAIKSLALVRKNTHKILNRFSTHLDAPYLTHRALQVNPEDAEDFLAALIAEELLAILEEGYVGAEADIDSITDWLSSSNDAEFILPLTQPKTLSRDQIVDLLKDGVDAWSQASNKQKKNPHKLPLTEMFKPKALDSQYLDEKFGLITTLRSAYEKREPRLMFGTIVQNVNNSDYWVCLQPRCDCVRLKTDRAFPFLPLSKSKENQKFNLVLADETQHIRLKLRDKPYDLTLITFSPHLDDREIIAAKLEDEAYYFTDTSASKYKWIGELRPEHAQRIANEFAANLSRVGLDESEWLRLWATRG